MTAIPDAPTDQKTDGEHSVPDFSTAVIEACEESQKRSFLRQHELGGTKNWGPITADGGPYVEPASDAVMREMGKSGSTPRHDMLDTYLQSSVAE
jgi:hypothetical protein